MIAPTNFFLIIKQKEFHLVNNRKEICQCDHIPFNLKGTKEPRQLLTDSFLLIQAKFGL